MKVVVGVIAAVVILVLLGALIFGGMYVSSRNEMVRKNEQIKSNWAQVDVVLQRRADLIPNLVATVQGFAAHEQTVFDDIAKARTQYVNAQTPADKIAASNQMYPLEMKILALAENYPQLKSNENFLRLQDELAGTENRIAVERKRYNDSIQDYNTFIGLFPNSIFAGWAGFKRNNDYFQAAEASREVPKVAFPAAKP
ncbi:MAG: LemA family protein [Candidatus Acidiferrales bacterium]